MKYLYLLAATIFLTGCLQNNIVVPEQALWWQPKPGLTWQWQLKGHLNTSYDVAVYDIDLFDTPADAIQKLHDRGVKVICYFSAGTFENWRPDAKQFPKKVIGKRLEDWPNEWWLDITKKDALAPIMTARLDLARAKQCDAVEPDNVDGYANDSGFQVSSAEQSRYNRWLADLAHTRGLAVGLKNDTDQIPDLINNFDFAVNEQCFEYKECDKLLPFTEANKAVFGVEYKLKPEQFCAEAKRLRLSWLKMDLELAGGRIGCDW